MPDAQDALEDLDDLIPSIDQLKQYLTTTQCTVRTEFSSEFSRSQDRWDPPISSNSHQGRHIRWFGTYAEGICFPPLRVQTPAQAEQAEVFYDRTGAPWVDANGKPLLWYPGKETEHFVSFAGPETQKAMRTVECLSHWVRDWFDTIKQLLFPGKLVQVPEDTATVWCDVVRTVSETGEVRRLCRPRYLVQTDPNTSVTCKSFRDAATLRPELLKRLALTPELLDRIGTEPEQYYCETHSLLEDTPAVIRYLRKRMKECCGPEEPSASTELDIANLERTSKQLDRETGEWIKASSDEMQKQFKYGVNTLRTARSRARSKGRSKGSDFGIDLQGRIWRKDPDDDKVFWYLKQSISRNSRR